jgi:glycosyltransferase involved in cell wall biosynthesis
MDGHSTQALNRLSTPEAHVHVLHVVPTLRAGGMELALARVINGSIPKGFSHSIVVLKGDPIIRDRIHPSVRIHCLYARSNDPFVPLRLRHLIRQESPSVVHARNLGAWPEVALARLTIWPPVPLIFSFHGVSEVQPVPWRWRALSRVLAKLTTRVFTVSQGSKKFLVDHIGMSNNDIRVIPNGVDTTRFRPTDQQTNNKTLVIGTVGSLVVIKNQALLVRACQRVIHQGVMLRLHIAGEGPERVALEALIQSLNMTEYVKLLGQVDDIPTFLNGLDIFALTSDSEAHPNALSEAAACGLPCVASRVGGIPEIVDQGKAALLFDRGDETTLASHLTELLLDESKRRALGEAARRFTVEQYAFTSMLERYQNMYQEWSRSGATPEFRR